MGIMDEIKRLARPYEDEENDEIILLQDGQADLDEVVTSAFILGMASYMIIHATKELNMEESDHE